MKKIALLCFFITFLFVNCSSVKEGASTQNIEIKGVSEVHDQFISENKLGGGGGILITEKGKITHMKGYGLVKNKPVTKTTVMRIASITKQFAAMCIMMLIEEDKIALTDKASKYLKGVDLPRINREITIDDLIRHKSGLVNFINRKQKESLNAFLAKNGYEKRTNKNHAEWIGTTELKDPTGQIYKYTNSGYVLLTRIVEVVTGKPFHEFQQERIFDVLNMKNTTDSKRFNGSGSMAISMEDYAKWDFALWKKDPSLLSKNGFEKIFSRGKFDNGTELNYGFGWHVTYKKNKLIRASHTGGGSPPAYARISIYRDFEREMTIGVFYQEDKTWNKKDKNGVQLKRVIGHKIHEYLTSNK